VTVFCVGLCPEPPASKRSCLACPSDLLPPKPDVRRVRKGRVKTPGRSSFLQRIAECLQVLGNLQPTNADHPMLLPLTIPSSQAVEEGVTLCLGHREDGLGLTFVLPFLRPGAAKG